MRTILISRFVVLPLCVSRTQEKVNSNQVGTNQSTVDCSAFIFSHVIIINMLARSGVVSIPKKVNVARPKTVQRRFSSVAPRNAIRAPSVSLFNVKVLQGVAINKTSFTMTPVNQFVRFNSTEGKSNLN